MGSSSVIRLNRAFFVTAVAVGLVVPCQPVAGKPNILLLIADDMGWGDIRSHGGPAARGSIRYTPSSRLPRASAGIALVRGGRLNVSKAPC